MRSADVGLVVALADRDHVRDVADAGVEGVFHAAEVRRERIQHRVRILLDAGLGQIRRVRHLRDRLGLTKDVTSICVTPASNSLSIRSSFCSKVSICLRFCQPSRGPHSRTLILFAMIDSS